MFHRALSLLSAGLDSSLATVLAIKQGYNVVKALTFNYGQKSAKKEIELASAICKYLKIPHQIINLPYFQELTSQGALLKSEQTLPCVSLQELDDVKLTRQTAEAVWVSNRNGVFIELAAAFAEDCNAESIIVGFNKEEAETFPDNSLAYMHKITEALYFSTKNHVTVISETVSMTKVEIVKELVRSDFPLHLLWSCYDAQEKMCGFCESCQRFKRALIINGIKVDAFFNNPF